MFFDRICNVVQLSSGLGNQMFQYAFGLAVDAAYDRSWFDEAKEMPGVLYRAYGLDQFLCEPRFADPKLARRHNPKILRWLGIYPGLRQVRERTPNVFEPELLKQKRSNFIGYFQCEKYFLPFRDRLLKEFRLRNPEPRFLELVERAHIGNTVSVHIRRGDYLSTPELGGVCDRAYYDRAMEHVRANVEKPAFWFFSDDPTWTQETFADVPNAVFVDERWTRSACDMMLMRECRHHIIANSSYSWWGAWLGEAPDKLVVAPSCWFADGRPTDIVPEGWVKF